MIDFRLVLVVFVFMSTGCSPFKSDKEPTDPSFFSTGESSLNPSTDKLVPKCLGSSEFDACLYLKNPVSQEKATVLPGDADAKRRFGVKIRGLAPTGFLENARVQVYSLNSPRFTIHSRADLKNSGHPEAIEQFSAYYWSNRLFDYLGARVGGDRLPLRALKIYVDDAFSGYSALNHSIHLEKKDGKLAKALSGEVVIQLVGQALADSLSEERVFTRDTTKHNFCVFDPKGCCTTEAGCAQALGSGFGDYVAAMMFPESARVGESMVGTSEGQKICSIARDLNSLSARSKSQVFQACDPTGRAALMGAWYASIWWKLRTQLEAQEAGAGADVDKMFFDHARSWTSTSTFADAKAAALNVARTYKSGLYTTAVTTAFTFAGI